MRTRPPVGAPLALAVALALVLAPAAATADMTKDQCIEANTQAQTLRRDGKLGAARAQLQKCGDPSCAAMVRDDCSRRIDEIERAQPTIIFDAKDGAGRDLAAVRVTVDGQPLAGALDGTALRVDPGPHAFTFTVADQPPVTSTFVLKEGEKERRERIMVGAPATAPIPSAQTPGSATASLPSTPPESTAGGGMGGARVVGLVVGGVGVAGIAVGSVFGLLTASAASQQKTDCVSPTSCAHYAQGASDHSTAQTDGTISTVGFIAGGALLAGGAVLFLLSGHSPEPSTAATLVVTPSVGPGAGGLSLTGGF